MPNTWIPTLNLLGCVPVGCQASHPQQPAPSSRTLWLDTGLERALSAGRHPHVPAASGEALSGLVVLVQGPCTKPNSGWIRDQSANSETPNVS